MTWVEELTKQYAEGKRSLEGYRAKLRIRRSDKIPSAVDLEISKVDSMIREMAYAIDWMETGRQPDKYRGVDRRGVYNEPYVLDRDLFPSLQDPEPPKPFRLTSEQRIRAIEAIRSMTDRERDCYLLHAAQGLSYSKIANELKLSKRTVQEYITRAKSKAQQAI